jgi:uncharacterized membrane protein YedE/YeeE
METVILQFGITALNLILAKEMVNQNKNPWFNYFVAGMTFGFGITQLIKLF